MSCKIEFDELESSLQWASGDALTDQGAFVDLETGKTIWTPADGLEADLPPDLELSERYVPVPTKRDLDLGSRLALRFAWQQLGKEDAERVEECFRRKGAYRRFRGLLEHIDRLDDWRTFEEEQTRQALEDWAEDHGIEIVDDGA